MILVLIGATMYSDKRRRKRMLQRIKSDDKKDFDISISYSNIDKEFVEDYLVPNLENGSKEKKFHCLLHITLVFFCIISNIYGLLKN